MPALNIAVFSRMAFRTLEIPCYAHAEVFSLLSSTEHSLRRPFPYCFPWPTFSLQDLRETGLCETGLQARLFVGARSSGPLHQPQCKKVERSSLAAINLMPALLSVTCSREEDTRLDVTAHSNESVGAAARGRPGSMHNSFAEL